MPPDEAYRLATLRSLGLLDTPPEERFDRITRLARRLFGVETALVSLVDADRQWFKSRQGLDAMETPRSVSFCGHAIVAVSTLIVPDARLDGRFADNPLVTGDPHIRFYAGEKVRAPNGAPLGTLCLLDSQPRQLDEGELAFLRDLCTMVEDEVRAASAATIDDLTGISNRRGFMALATQTLAMCRVNGRDATLMFIDLDGFKSVNDTFGHAAGDRALVEVGHLLISVFRDLDVIARLGGDEFVVLLSGVGADEVGSCIARLEAALDERNARTAEPFALGLSVGATVFDRERHDRIEDLVGQADAEMYARKADRQNRRSTVAD